LTEFGRRSGRRRATNPIDRKKELSAEARVIKSLKKEQPQNRVELSKSTGLSERQLYRIFPLLEEHELIKMTEGGYALWTYSDLEESMKKVIERWKDMAFRYPTVHEIAVEIGITPEDAEKLAYKFGAQKGWFIPQPELINESKERLGEALVCAARLRDGEVTRNGKYNSYLSNENSQILKDANHFLKKYPEMVPKRTFDKAGKEVLTWSSEALKYVGNFKAQRGFYIIPKMKFKILPKVHGFTDNDGIKHLPGDIVELPESYLGENWLEPVDEAVEKKPESKTESTLKKDAATSGSQES
jgi:predicted transcriptional regulator